MIRGHFDGASRGNPGAAGAGAVICEDGVPVWFRAQPLGQKTNNEAEYTALSLLLDELERRGAQGAEICGDSKLVISQITGVWKIKEPRLKALAEPLIARVKALSARCRWIPRAENAEADRMSNYALDKGAYEKSEDRASELIKASSAEDCPMTAQKVAPAVWIVTDGGDSFAVDLKHSCCSCSHGRKGGCRHFQYVLTQIQKNTK